MAIRLSASTLTSPTKYNQTYQTFRGVDLTHSKISVEGYRAVDMRNFIMENEANTKRFGWEELYRFEGLDNQINGIWTLDTSYPITDEQGNITDYSKDSVVLVQVAKKFYIIRDFGIENSNINNVKSTINRNNNIIEVPFQLGADQYVLNEKSEAYVRGNRLYILCGDLLVFGKWAENNKWTGNETYEIRRVYDDVDTYIPTIITKIICKDSNYLNTEETFNNNVALDDRNMMSSKVKMTLLGESDTSDRQSNLEYDLSFGLKINYIDKVIANGVELQEVSDYNFDNETNILTLTNNHIPTVVGEDNIEVLLTYTNPSKDLIRECKFGLVYGYNGLRDRLFVSGNKDYPNLMWHSSETNETEESDFTYFSDIDYIKLGNTNNSIMGMYIQGDGTMVVLKSPSSQEPTIYFVSAEMSEAIDYTGQVVTDLEGNPLYEETYPVQIGAIGVGLKKRNGIYNLNGDPLMISDNGIYGIVLGDNVASQQRYAKLRSRLIDNAITNIVDLENTACICYKNKFYIADTSTGLCYIADSRYPIRLNDDLNDTYQYEWWIWDDIYARLFFEYKEDLYMATDNGQIVKFKSNNFKDVSYRNIKAGAISYDMDKKIFVIARNSDILDITTWEEYEKLHNEDRVNFNEKLDIKALILNNDEIYIENNYICCKINVTNEENMQRYIDLKTTLFLIQTIEIAQDNLELLNNVYVVYLDKINDSITNLNTNTKYVIRFVEALEEEPTAFILRFKLATPQQALQGVLPEVGYTKINDTDTPFRISMAMPQDLIIDNLQTENGLLYSKTFKMPDGYWYYYDEYNNVISLNTTEKPEFNYFDLTAFEFNNKKVEIIEYEGLQALNFIDVEVPALLTLNNQIYAYYTTSWFNLGTDIYLKNLLNVYVVPDPVVSNKVEFAFETRRKEASYETYTGKTFDFNDLDFNDVSFASNQIPSVYQKKFKTKKFSYIRFIFKNNDDNTCKLARVTIEYTTTTRVKGEK